MKLIHMLRKLLLTHTIHSRVLVADAKITKIVAVKHWSLKHVQQFNVPLNDVIMIISEQLVVVDWGTKVVARSALGAILVRQTLHQAFIVDLGLFRLLVVQTLSKFGIKLLLINSLVNPSRSNHILLAWHLQIRGML